MQPAYNRDDIPVKVLKNAKILLDIIGLLEYIYDMYITIYWRRIPIGTSLLF